MFRSTRRTFLTTTGSAIAIALGARRSSAAAYDAFEKSVAELQADMAAGKTSAGGAGTVLRAPDCGAGSGRSPPECRRPSESAGRGGRTRARPRAPPEGCPRTAARHPGAPERQFRHPRHADHRRVAGALGSRAARRRVSGTASARRRCRAPRQGEPARARARAHDRELARRPDARPVRPEARTGSISGGSGVAVAANFAAFAMGTDTSGSIRIPASHNCLVGLRPTAGLSSRAGIIPFGHTQDTGGPMARSVADVAVALTLRPDTTRPTRSRPRARAACRPPTRRRCEPTRCGAPESAY